MGLRTVINNAEVQVICKNDTGVTIFRPIASTTELNNVKDVVIKYDMGHLKSFSSAGRPGKRHGSKESVSTPESKQIILFKQYLSC